MDTAILVDCIKLFEMVSVVMVIAYLFSRSRFYQEILEHRPTISTHIILALIFGILSIYGMSSGINYFGAVVNIRDLGPIIGGLSCGPFVGIGAGIIGTCYRLSVGGPNVFGAALGPIISGICGSAIFILNKREVLSTKYAIIATIGIEVGVSLITLLIRALGGSTSTLLTVFINVAVPMICLTSVAAGIFAFIIHNLIQERQVKLEKEKLEQEIAKKEAELSIAAEIQKSFLPDSLPYFPKYEMAGKSIPAKEVGGDFFDFMPLELIPFSKSQMGIMIADVAGKGVPAALFMALSRIVIRISALWFKNCAEAIAFANPVITHDSKTGMFVTLFLGILDNETMTMSYVNAGHNPPLVFRTGTEKIEELKPTGIAIGVIEDIAFDQKSVHLQNGDVVVLYTDGVTEAINTNTEEFGVPRLIQTIKDSVSLPSQEMVDTIVTRVTEFCGAQPQHDDITLLVIKVHDS
ncbi:SpoIIE family protein phosphatase [Methanospirillum lacunae]|uniref:Stage II sporulation protein E n=1 Tax=Methanospirillum lacunae TaxID=668570 RepID=A0A2V2MRX2_9EURY|nr:SpoIIE family protein phosphatase [Methanospirillum lacunae]PWR70984.1 stage II sporulation protein E [Methanospirillum lacunae]